MTENDHEGCENHQSVMRGVCYCPGQNTVFINPRLMRTGEIFLSDHDEKDLHAVDTTQMMLELWFDVLDDKFVAIADNSTMMPGMMGECEQVPGHPGYDLMGEDK